MNTHIVLLTMTSGDVNDIDGPIERAFADGAHVTRSTIERRGGKLVEVFLTHGTVRWGADDRVS